MTRFPRGPAFAVLLVSAIFVATASLGLGAFTIRLPEVVHGLISGPAHAEAVSSAVLWNLRVPRVLLAMLVGATLAVAGALMQGLFRNPLAEPGLIGVSSGAALGAVLVIVLGGALFPAQRWASDLSTLPIAAFVGALAVSLLIQRIASSGGYTAVATLLLAGIAVNALAGAVLGFSMFLADDASLRSLTFWTLGSLGGASWGTLAWAAPLCLGMLLLAPVFAGALNAIALGESEASHLGFRVERIKAGIILLTAAGVGAAVAFTGIIGFVGLVVPHLVRLMLGPDHRALLPASAILGALLLTAADTAARTLVAPAELPIGIFTSAFGAPFFVFMLLRQRSRALWN